MVTNNAINVATAATGTVLQGQGVGTAPAFSTATYPSTATGTGTILRADGTNWVATTATYPATTTINQVLYSSAANTISGLATANNAVLNTSGAGVPSITTYPQITGLGIGASPGSTAGITFDGTNFLNNYVILTTYTPVLTFGGGNTGIVYSAQTGFYMRIGNICFVKASVKLTSKGTSTGTAKVSLPLTTNTTNTAPIMTTNIDGPINLDAGYTWVVAVPEANTTVVHFSECGSGKGIQSLSDTNFTDTSLIGFAGIYFL